MVSIKKVNCKYLVLLSYKFSSTFRKSNLEDIQNNWKKRNIQHILGFYKYNDTCISGDLYLIYSKYNVLLKYTFIKIYTCLANLTKNMKIKYFKSRNNKMHENKLGRVVFWLERVTICLVRVCFGASWY